MADHSRAQAPRSLLRWAGLLVFLVALGAYLPNLGNDFSMDDAYNVVGNARIRSLAHVPEFFTEAWGSDAGGYATAINRAYYRPVAQVSFALDYALYGLAPWGYHLTNDLLHALVSLCVFGLLVGLKLRLAPALLGALWFAVHPVHSEAVHLVTYRTELLATGFALLALLLHVRRGLGRWTPLAVAALFALGLGSKETAVTLPGWIALLHFARGLRWRRLLADQAPLFVVLAGYLALRAALLSPPDVRFFDLETPALLASVLSIFATYVRLLVWPWPLTPFYDWGILPPAGGLLEAGPLLGLLLLIVTSLTIVHLWRGERRVALGLGWGLLGLIPFAHLVPLPVGAAERFLYFASAGVALALAAALESAPRRWFRPAAVFVGVGLIVYAGLTVRRAADWRNDETLLVAVVEDFPSAINAPLALGRLHCERGDVATAHRWFREADRRVPALAPNIDAWVRCLAGAGREEEAREVLARARGRRPGEATWDELMVDVLGKE